MQVVAPNGIADETNVLTGAGSPGIRDRSQPGTGSRVSCCVLLVGIVLLAFVLAAGCTDSRPMYRPADVTVPETPDSPDTPETPMTVFTRVTPTPLPVRDVNETDDGTTLVIPFGHQVRVHLSENTTTGYTWKGIVPKGVTLARETVIAWNSSFADENGGYHEWLLFPEAPDTYTFRAIYRPSSEEVRPSDPAYLLVLVVTRN